MPERVFDSLLLTCEHGGNRVPACYRSLFRGRRDLLDSHRGHDPGALAMARTLQDLTGAPVVSTGTTRLLIDPNRPIGHPRLFSEISRELPEGERARIVRTIHAPHWNAVRARLRRTVGRGRRVLHLGCHSFTPVWEGRERNVDLGLLYDPARPREADLCARWAKSLARTLPHLRVRRNRPYFGSTPGLTTSMRTEWPDDLYLGVEIELTQAAVHWTVAERRAVHRALADTLLGLDRT